MNKIEEKVVKIAESMGSITSLFLHTLLFLSCFIMILIGFDFNKVMLTLTTIVSLEAIYLAIFIQMSVNRNTKALSAVEKNVHEIQEDVEVIQEDVENIEKDIDEIQEDVEEINEEVSEISEDVHSIEKDIDEIQEDVECINEDVSEISEDVQNIKKI